MKGKYEFLLGRIALVLFHTLACVGTVLLSMWNLIHRSYTIGWANYSFWPNEATDPPWYVILLALAGYWILRHSSLVFGETVGKEIDKRVADDKTLERAKRDQDIVRWTRLMNQRSM